MKARRAAVIGLAGLTWWVVWTATAPLPVMARIWTCALLAVLPALMIMQAADLDGVEDAPRIGLYVTTGFSLWLLTIPTVLATRASGWGAAELLLRPVPPATFLAWSVGLVVASVLVFLGARALGVRESHVTRHLLPVTGAERRWFVGLSLTAGFTEELIFRGFLLTALAQATGSMAAAVVVSSALFGIVHGYQGLAGAVRPALLGLLLATSAVATGSILPAIVAHAAVDILSGLWLGHRLIR